MENKVLKRALMFFALFVVVRVLLIAGINEINSSLTHYLTAVNNQIIIDKRVENHLYTVDNIQTNDSNTTLYIKGNTSQELSLLIDNLTFLHEIYINEELVSQNIDKTSCRYDGDYAYKVFDISDDAKIQIEGSGASKVTLFLANQHVMKNTTEVRTIFHTVMLMCLALLTLVSATLYIRNRHSKWFLVFVVMGIVSVIKSVGLGELFVLAESVGLTAHNYRVLDYTTSIINTMLPICILLYLYDIKLSRRWKVAISVCLSLLCLLSLLFGGLGVMRTIVMTIVLIFSVAINCYGFMNDKPFCTAILMNDVVYASFAHYKGMLTKNFLKDGTLDFYVNSAYLGAIIYLSAFLLIFVLDYLKKIKALKEKETEFERVRMLRGISHDLKLPLSVIKMSTQMLERYNMSTEKKKKYTKAAIEATLELEKMTDNINSYLKLGWRNEENSKTSLRDGFAKLISHFDICNKDKNYIITVTEDEKDWFLLIDSIQFDRMMYNLVDNALKYSKEQGEVKVSYKLLSQEVQIIVEDQGVGMDEDQLDRIFAPFYRIDPSRSIEGLGLGLSVVRGIVDSLKGKIIVESKKDVGTKITLLFPK